MNLGHLIQVSEAVKEIQLSSVTSNVEEDSSGGSPSEEEQCSGGFLDGGKLAWRAHNSTVEIFNPKLGYRHAAWTFTSVGREQLIVTSVCGIGTGNITHVAIGVNMGDAKAEGMVAVLSLRRSRIIRAFSFPYHVTKICMISGGEKVVDPTTLANELRFCQGLLAVGTDCAELYLVDLCLDFGYDEITSDETCPALFSTLVFPDEDPEITRRKAVMRKRHPVLCLSEHHVRDENIFCFYGPDRKILHEAPKNTVSITSLSYVPQLASLIVGYSFGSFQMFNLSLVTVDCASPLERNIPPVVDVSYQEPEDDPRSFVYLWISRSWSEEDYEDENFEKADSCSFSLYAMNYEKKEWIEGHGLWYKGLASMSGRYEFEPFGDINGQIVPSNKSVILSTFTVQDATTLGDQCPTVSPIAITSDEESDPVPDLSLTCFCWQTSFRHNSRQKTHYYVAVFDINQWYQAQMPGSLRLDNAELCPYMSFCVLSDSSPTSTVNVLATCPLKGTWSRYISRCNSDKDWYPSSLSFDLQLITSGSLITLHCPSIQHKVLSSLVEQGPGAIVEPHEAEAACQYAGILLKDSCPTNPTLEHVVQRENLLNVALDHQLLSFIANCVSEFIDGKFSNVGCSLTLLSDWAWNKVFTLKSACDKLCLPFFDASLPLDNSSLNSLHQNLISLDHVRSIISSLATATASTTDSYPRELEGRVEVVDLLQLHLKACLWFYQSGLLPEISAQSAQAGDTMFPFPADTLQELYDKRYHELREANSRCQLSEMLLIETLTEECGEPLKEIWRKDGQNGVYPPPSFHALLTMYLLPQIPVVTKHRIVQYLFLDLASLLSENNYGSVIDELVKFPSSFSLSPSIIKLTQAFWLIDHKDFQEGKGVLLHPLVNPEDITSKQHQAIVRSLLYQNEEKSAMAYSEVREPPHLKAQQPQFYIKLLLANGKIREAFHLRRSRGDAAMGEKLLHYLFVGCEELDRLESITHLPLTLKEEQQFMAYLADSKNPSAKDIMFTYSLQKSRLCGKYQTSAEFEDPKIERARDALLQGFLTHLPNTEATKVSKNNGMKIFSKPQPLSTVIRQPNGIPAKLDLSLQEVKASLPPAFTPFRSLHQRRKDWQHKTGIENESIEDEFMPLEASHIVIPSIKHTPIHRGLNQSITRTQFGNTFSEFNLNSPVHSPKKTESDVVRQLEDIIRRSHNALEQQGLTLSETPTGKLSSDVLSMLRTPPPSVQKFNLSMASEACPDTPQSILKVRGRSRMNSGCDTPLSSKIRYLTSLNKRASDESFATQVSMTPKQLRFQFPSGETPTPPSSHRDQDTDDSSSPPAVGHVMQQLNFSVSGDSPKVSDESDHTKITSKIITSTEQSYTEISYPDETMDEDRLEGIEIKKIHNNSVLTDDSFHSIENDSESEYADKPVQNTYSLRSSTPSPRRSSSYNRTPSCSPDFSLKITSPLVEVETEKLISTSKESPVEAHKLDSSSIEASPKSVANEDELILTFSDSEPENSPIKNDPVVSPSNKKSTVSPIPILQFSDSEDEPQQDNLAKSVMEETDNYVLRFSDSESEEATELKEDVPADQTRRPNEDTPIDKSKEQNVPQSFKVQDDQPEKEDLETSPNKPELRTPTKVENDPPAIRRSQRLSATPSRGHITATPVLATPPRRKRKASEISDDGTQSIIDSNKKSRKSVNTSPKVAVDETLPKETSLSSELAENLNEDEKEAPTNLEETLIEDHILLEPPTPFRTSPRQTPKTESLKSEEIGTATRRGTRRSASVEPTQPLIRSGRRTRRGGSVDRMKSPKKSEIVSGTKVNDTVLEAPSEELARVEEIVQIESEETSEQTQSSKDLSPAIEKHDEELISEHVREKDSLSITQTSPNRSTEKQTKPSRRTRRSVSTEPKDLLQETPRRTRRSMSTEPTEPEPKISLQSKRSDSVEPTNSEQGSPRRTRRSMIIEPSETGTEISARTRRSSSAEPTNSVQATPRRTRRSISKEPVQNTPRRTRRSLSTEISETVQEKTDSDTSSLKSTSPKSRNTSPKTSPKKDKATELNIPKEAFLTMPPITTPKRRSVSKVATPTRKSGRRNSVESLDPNSSELPMTPKQTKSKNVAASPITPSRRSTRKSLAFPALNETPLETISEAQEVEDSESPAKTPSRATRSTRRKTSNESDDQTSVKSPEVEYDLIKLQPDQLEKSSSVPVTQKRKRRTGKMTSLKMPLNLQESPEAAQPVKKLRKSSARKKSSEGSSSNSEESSQETAKAKPVRKSTRKSARK